MQVGLREEEESLVFKFPKIHFVVYCLNQFSTILHHTPISPESDSLSYVLSYISYFFLMLKALQSSVTDKLTGSKILKLRSDTTHHTQNHYC